MPEDGALHLGVSCDTATLATGATSDVHAAPLPRGTEPESRDGYFGRLENHM